MAKHGWMGVWLAAGCWAACGSHESDAQFKDQVTTGMHDSLLGDIDDLVAATQAVQAAAPTPADRGWDATLDATAIADMKTQWVKARTAYEHIEGALAPLFPEIDFSIDARYDDFLATLGDTGDQDLFDGTGVTGLHAVERILYAPEIPQHVITFEQNLGPGYVAASFPTTAAQAAEFRTGLCAKMIADAQTLQSQWSPQKIDLAGSYQGLVDLMAEQKEKVLKAATSEEESRYSQHTMDDLRDNLAGTQKIYGLFRTWIQDRSTKALDGKTVDGNIQAGFGSLTTLYASDPGDAIPQPPDDWSAESPSAADLQTPFGVLYSHVLDAADPDLTGSVVSQMTDAELLIGLDPVQ